MILDHVAVRAFIGRGNGGFERGNTGNQDEVGIRRNFPGEAQQFDTCGSWHTHIGDYNVEERALQLTLGFVHVVGDFDAMGLPCER